MTAPPNSDTPLPEGLIYGEDGRVRCRWASAAPDFARYHDTEWGFPVDDDHALFEKICLEGFQSGLSWRTILAKRPAFRDVFCDFNFERVARFEQADVERLVTDARIVRHRGKIAATINNARRACEAVEAHGSLGALIWRYEPPPVVTLAHQPRQVVSKTQHSTKLAADLKKLGWRFWGPTTAYAFMQAMGLVNDHVQGCVVRNACQAARTGFNRPTAKR